MNRCAVEAVPSLLPHTSDPHAYMRQWTALALGVLGDQRVVPLLLPLLNDENPEVRTYTALALGRLGDPSGLDLVCAHIAFCAKSYSYLLLDYALLALKTLHAPVVPLLTELADKLSLQAMVLVAEIFEEQGDPAALPALEHMLEQDNESVRTAAQQAIDRLEEKGRKDQ